MFFSQRAIPADSKVIALVELDIKKMRVRIVLVPQAIRERLRELEYPVDPQGDRQLIEAELGKV